MAAFTAGNIVVYRVGGVAGTSTSGTAGTAGTAALSSAATQVFLDEYTPSGTLVQSIALPTTTSGANLAFTDSGSATSAGLISDAGNGSSILLSGYDDPVGTAGVTGSSASTVPRVIGIVSASGQVDTSTSLGTTYDSGNNARSAASADGTNLYAGTGVGIGYTTDGGTTTPTATNAVNTRQVEVVNGQLYYGTSSGTAGIYSAGTGTPTAAGQTSTLVAASASPYGFTFAHLGPTAGTTPDTLYVADSTNGIEKFTFNGTAYVASGTVALANVTGVTATVSGGTVTLYATTPTAISTLVDASGFNGTLTGAPTTLVTAAANTAFRGDALAPTAPVCFASGTRIRAVRDGRRGRTWRWSTCASATSR